MIKSRVILLVLIAVTLILVGCAQPGTAGNDSDVCPEPAPETALLKNDELGYCLLHPDSYIVEANDNGDVLVIDSIMNHVDPRVDINVEESSGRTAAAAADEASGGFPAEMGIERSDMSLGDEEAVVLDNYPGQDISRLVFVVHGDRLYRLTFTHTSPDLGETYTQAENLYTVVTNSFRFLPLP
jgi:hypothetical protein